MPPMANATGKTELSDDDLPLTPNKGFGNP
jgi:hypothetical protein